MSADRIKGKSARIGAACFCMLAVTLLHAPLAAAALLAHGMDCCTGAYCPIQEHHHRKQAPTQEEKPMDCGHDMGGMMACSMSCCQNPVRPAVTPAVFVMPTPAIVPSAGEVIRPVVVAHSSGISQATEPPSPPPRFVSPVL